MKKIYFFNFTFDRTYVRIPTNALCLAIEWKKFPTANHFDHIDFSEKAKFSYQRYPILEMLKNQFFNNELQRFLDAKVDQPNWYRRLWLRQ